MQLNTSIGIINLQAASLAKSSRAENNVIYVMTHDHERILEYNKNSALNSFPQKEILSP